MVYDCLGGSIARRRRSGQNGKACTFNCEHMQVLVTSIPGVSLAGRNLGGLQNEDIKISTEKSEEDGSPVADRQLRAKIGLP